MELLLEVILIKLAIYIVSTLISQGSLSAKGVISNCIPNNYFAIFYIALYIISPYINLVLNKLSKKNYKRLLVMLLIVFCFWNTIVNEIENITNNTYTGLSTVSISGSQAGYTIVNFIVLYIVGAYLRLFDIKISKKKYSLLLIILSVLLAWSYIESILKLRNIVAWNYDNPLIILQAAIVFLIFKNINKEIKIINELAKASFTVFLIHTTFFRFLNIKDAVNYNFIEMTVNIIISSICIYLIGYLIYKIYHFATKYVIKFISKYTEKINISLNESNIVDIENKFTIKTLQAKAKSDINIK